MTHSASPETSTYWTTFCEQHFYRCYSIHQDRIIANCRRYEMLEKFAVEWKCGESIIILARFGSWVILGVPSGWLTIRAGITANHITILCLYSVLTYLGTLKQRVRTKLITKYNFAESRIMHTPFQQNSKLTPQKTPISFLASFKLGFHLILLPKISQENTLVLYHLQRKHHHGRQ
jgi:hypothetical protein